MAGAAGMAGSVSGFLASGMGTAVLASGLGAAGGSFSGSRLAHLIGEHGPVQALQLWAC